MDHSIAGAERSIAGAERRTPGMVRREGSRVSSRHVLAGIGLNGLPPGPRSGLISRDYFRPGRFTSSRTCGTMLTRAVFSEGDAARPMTVSQPPVRAN
jgi:hypothetical protein